MSARYRVIYFVPDPFLGGRVPIAALVEAKGRVDVVRAPLLPGPQCLGGRAEAAVLQILLEDISIVRDLDGTPRSLGPHAALDPARDLPEGVGDPVAWIARLFTPTAHASASTRAAPEHHHPPHRATYGYQFLTTWKVERYVRKTFHPETDLDGFLARASALGPISHFVPGARDVLLMEPIVPRRESWSEDVRTIARTFGAYKTALREGRVRRKTRLIAYVLSGATPDTLAAIHEDLSTFADEVIDTGSRIDRGHFLEAIRVTGQSADAKSLLD